MVTVRCVLRRKSTERRQEHEHTETGDQRGSALGQNNSPPVLSLARSEELNYELGRGLRCLRRE